MNIYPLYHWIVIIFILTSCLPAPASEIVPVTPLSSETIAAASTLELTFTPSITPLPTNILSRPIPTTTAKESSDITLELLRTNNNCELPCWWGITPNQTLWTDANIFLRVFSKIYERDPSSEWLVYEVYSPLAKEYSSVFAARTVYATQQGIVKEIDISDFNVQAYALSSILAKYGAPSQILVSTYSSDYGLPPNQVPLSVDLYYPEKGINALYSTYATVIEEKIVGCISEDPDLFLWSPSENNRSIEYILEWNRDHILYMSIDKAVGLDVQAFFEKYSSPAIQPCIETATSLWPAQ